MIANNIHPNKNPSEVIRRIRNQRNSRSCEETKASFTNNFTRIMVGKAIVGFVENGIFYKKLHSSRHFLKKPKAIAFDVDSLDQARKLGAKQVKIFDLDSGIVYSISIDIIYQKGFTFNRGYGNQIGLTLNHWQFHNSHPKSSDNLEVNNERK